MEYIVNQNKSVTGMVESEQVRYATIALISDREKTEYSNNKLLRSKVWCKKCGIEYLRDISPSCPLCEIKEMLLASEISRVNEKKSAESEDFVEKRENTDTDSAAAEPEMPIRQTQTQNVREYKNGDVIRMGVYAGQAVEWLILKKTKGRALLLSKYVLDVAPYNSKYTKSTWENCSLRSYLNGEFYQNTFSDSEKKVIESVCLDNKTNDKIFCLSIDEADRYFRNDTDRCAAATSYAASKIGDFFMEIFINKDTKAAGWWLRTPSFAYNNKYAFCVSGTGESPSVNTVNDSFVGIRPALWMKV